MKKHITDLLATSLAWLSIMSVTSCSNDDAADVNHLLEVKSVLPTKVMEGQVITITGTGLDKVTSVVFPGNVAVNNISKVAGGYITITTPAGIAAEGGSISVEADGESAVAPMSLTVGKPNPQRVAPIDQAIKINECVEVYGKDLEFITKAYFPGEDGQTIVVEASNFKRKATGALFIYSPMGIKAGPAQVVLEDCSGKKFTLPEVTLSDEVSGGSEETGGERYVPIWQDEVYIYDWANWQYLTTDQLSLEGIQLHEGLMMRLTFDNPDGASVCVCDANWGTPDVDGQGNNTVWVPAGTTELEFPISQGMVETINAGGGIIIGGGNFTLKKIELFREYPTLWSGEYTTGWWWYLPASELDLSAITPEAGQIIRFTFTHHDAPQTFCLCDGWWGAPYIRDGGESDHNITLAAGEDFLEFEISEGMAATMNGGDTALIIGGDITITKIQIKTE
jgi:hypothetical protein